MPQVIYFGFGRLNGTDVYKFLHTSKTEPHKKENIFSFLAHILKDNHLEHIGYLWIVKCGTDVARFRQLADKCAVTGNI